MNNNFNNFPNLCPSCGYVLIKDEISESDKKLLDTVESLYKVGDPVYKCPKCKSIWIIWK
ncbi:hypothetical protein M0R19_03380 [Candidatus Pacearchaeota archaeon]|jgi:predicted Zn-ribbon and HTH transcriptional regulator|nr:hypothetical protein [Candidatus Pacearchaeota archaeon]